ncbi:MAG: hypothetical protein C0480_06320 [Bradyrhizobium sp.]|nr:hypothetical protein [Bradyrhizobium sp.]
MAGYDDNYVVDADGKRVLIGLTLDETIEFERLDEAILDSVSEEDDDCRARNERRWLVLYDKHDAALRNYLSTENARALRALRWAWTG